MLLYSYTINRLNDSKMQGYVEADKVMTHNMIDIERKSCNIRTEADIRDFRVQCLSFLSCFSDSFKYNASWTLGFTYIFLIKNHSSM